MTGKLDWEKARRQDRATKPEAEIPNVPEGGHVGASLRDLSPEEVQRLYPPPLRPSGPSFTCRVCHRRARTKYLVLPGHPPVELCDRCIARFEQSNQDDGFRANVINMATAPARRRAKKVERVARAKAKRQKKALKAAKRKQKSLGPDSGPFTEGAKV